MEGRMILVGMLAVKVMKVGMTVGPICETGYKPQTSLTQ
jgi:hypothetical protein